MYITTFYSINDKNDENLKNKDPTPRRHPFFACLEPVLEPEPVLDQPLLSSIWLEIGVMKWLTVDEVLMNDDAGASNTWCWFVLFWKKSKVLIFCTSYL